MPDTVLELRGLNGWYGESHVLHGVDLELRRGESLALLGRNGAGKTSILRAITGVMRKRRGSVRLGGQETVGLEPWRIARMGLAYVPEERGIFASLTVDENLRLPPVLSEGGMSIDEVHTLFPNLAERRSSPGTRLSGGEQQMLAIARVLRSGSKTLLLDEPTEGLAPVIVDRIGEVIQLLRTRGYSILLVEQNLAFARAAADRCAVIEHGQVVDLFAAADFETHRATLQHWLGV